MQHFRRHIQRAITLAGSQSKLAEQLDISQQNVSRLMTRATRVPAELAVAIEKVTEGRVRKSDLRPDLFNERAA